MSLEHIARDLLAGDPRAIARAISLVEDETPAGHELIATIYPHTGRAYLVGVTGSPGAGKSTLVDRLAGEIRRSGRTAGVLAIDPTSPFTGGALLGDRVRMSAHADDPGVFIRSMATRGHLGGLARATADAALILDAAGRDIVVIETVGVGQDEVDIVGTADVSLVLLVPGAGDDVQAIKAGIMEIADVFVVNKADREGADRVVQSIAANLSLQSFGPDDWRPPIVKTDATTGAGVDALWNEVERFRGRPPRDHQVRRRARHDARLRTLLARQFLRQVDRVLAPAEWDGIVDRMAARQLDPYSAASQVLARVTGEPPAQASTPAGGAADSQEAPRQMAAGERGGHAR